MHHRRIGLAAACMLTTTSLVLAALPAAGASERARWRVIARDAVSTRIEIAIPAPNRTIVDVDGTTYTALTIDGAGLLGEPGAPGLPVLGHLVEVPAGARVGARVVDATMDALPGGCLLPVQPAGAKAPVIDPGAYARAGWVRVTAPAAVIHAGRVDGAQVLVGAAQIMAGQAVVAVNVIPVAYDPGNGRIAAASRVVIELRFDAPDGKAAPASRRGAALDDRPGTWALVYGYETALTPLQPLIDWRRQEGYHVEIIHGPGPNTDVKAQLQALYDDPGIPPLTYVVLAGDTWGPWGVPTWHEGLSQYGGEGDHYYTLLDGDDILSDVHIGRLSFSDLETAGVIVNKVLNYETAPPRDDTNWFTEGCLIGDPSSSGITTITVNQWLKGRLLASGYSAVDTIWGGDFSTQFLTSLNLGKSAFGYRGYLEMSGISPALIGVLTNGGRLPVAIIPTCDTGSFDGSYVCHSEAFLRASGGGAVAAIGTATVGTHTRYNNCYYQGTWNGLLERDPHIGVAHTLGKLELYDNYFLAEPDKAEIWAVWNNLMGDPATPIWLGVPSAIAAYYPAQVAVGAGSVTISVVSDGAPVQGARVCLYREGELQVVGHTSEFGATTLVTPPLSAGTCTVTATALGMIPYRGDLTVGEVAVACEVAAMTIDDSAGNGDGMLDPGETALLSLAITNLGTATASAVAGTLIGGDPWGRVVSGVLSFGDIAPGDTVWAAAPVTIAVDAGAPDGAVVRWPLPLTATDLTFTDVVQATVHGPSFSVSDPTWSEGETFEPGQTGTLVITLANDGSVAAPDAAATLTTDSPWLEITDTTGSFGAIGSGDAAANTLDPFGLTIAPGCFPGHLAVLRLTIADGAGGQSVRDVPVTVGTAATDAPTGPGAGGYYAFDDTDVASGHAPVYDWVALDPVSGGPGVSLDLDDQGFEQDQTRTIDLPFPFRYYGVAFDRVSICSNGWLALGETPLVQYRNVTLPAAGSPGSLIAVFWDDLYQIGNADVYTWYDAAQHRFIAQWYNLLNNFSRARENFEVILLDPAWHPTATGDGAIIMQYAEVHNTDTRDGYATVGIQNHDRTGGLLYTYWNQYAAGGTPLEAGRAIRFEPIGAVALPQAEVTPASIVVTVPPGGHVTRTLHVANTGAAGSQLGYAVAVVDPAVLPPEIAHKAAATPAPPNLDGSTLTFDTSSFEPGTTVDIAMSVYADGEGIFPLLTIVALQCPSGVTLNDATDLGVATGDTLTWLGPAGDEVVTVWDGLADGGSAFIPLGNTATGTLNVSFAPDAAGEVTFAYSLEDIGLYGQPDQVVGTITLTSDQPYLDLHTPVAGTVAVIGQELPITFTAGNGSGLVDVAIQRDEAGPWSGLATDVDAAAGAWTWLVAGNPGPYARIRVSDAQDTALSDSSSVFAVGRDVSWVQPGLANGVVPGGAEATIVVTLHAADVSSGTQDALLRVTTSAGGETRIPVTLQVAEDTAVDGDTPGAVKLRGNHPNPFNPMTSIAFSLPRAMAATLDVFAPDGKRVRRLVAGTLDAGSHEVIWDGTDARGRTVASGVYLVRLVTDDGITAGKMLLAR